VRRRRTGAAALALTALASFALVAHGGSGERIATRTARHATRGMLARSAFVTSAQSPALAAHQRAITAQRRGSARASATPPALLPPPHIVKDLIPFGAKRRQEMRSYALEHYGIDSYKLIDPHLIIWHYTESSTFQSVWNTFADDVPDVEFHELPQVCAHFVIDTNGTIYQVVPLDIMCRQVVGLNYTAIGIENVGFSDQQVMGDAPQFRAALELTHWLRCLDNIPVANVIGHNESLSSPYYRELVPAFRGQTHLDFNRADMNVVRARVAALPCRRS
jgi:beta-N-acetylhexosaminidase